MYCITFLTMHILAVIITHTVFKYRDGIILTPDS